jgi:hypothetical protein
MKPEKKKIVRNEKNTTNESSSSATQSGSGISQGLSIQEKARRREEEAKAAAAKKRKSEDAKRREEAAKSDAAAKNGQSKGNAVAKKSKEAKGTSPKSKIPSTNATIRYNGKNVPQRSKTGYIGNVQHEVSQILTVGKGASPSDLKTVVEMIPKDVICEMYKCTFSSFEVEINEKLASAQDFSSTGDVLYRVLKKFLVWTLRTKGEEDTSKKRKAKEEAEEEEIKEPIPRKKRS